MVILVLFLMLLGGGGGKDNEKTIHPSIHPSLDLGSRFLFSNLADKPPLKGWFAIVDGAALCC